MSHGTMGPGRKLLLWAGVATALAVVLARPLGLSASAGLSPGKIALGALAVLLLLGAWLGRSLLSLYKGIALLIANTIVLLLVVEATLLFAARIRDAFVQPDPARREQLRYTGDGREQLPYYQAKPWAKQYWREYHRAWNPDRLRFEPYLLWRSAPFSGETLEIGPDGVRRTPASVCGEDSLNVFSLGGSAMWGTGVPDRGTLPNLLAGALERRLGRPVCMVNLAEQAYVSTQELLRLLFELRGGAHPDVVLFYDGVNDVIAAYQAGRAGVPQNLEEIRGRVEGPGPSLGDLLLERLAKTRTLRLARRLSGRSKPGNPYAERDVDLEALAPQIVDAALQSYRVVETLGERYGFASLFFWQPVLLLEDKPLTTEEAGMRRLAEEIHPGLTSLYERAYGLLPRGADPPGPSVRRLDGTLHDTEELCYIDPWHVTVEANQQLVAAMIDAVASTATGTASSQAAAP